MKLVERIKVALMPHWMQKCYICGCPKCRNSLREYRYGIRRHETHDTPRLTG